MEPKKSYHQCITELLDKIYRNEKERIKEAAHLMSDAIVADKMIHVFGTGGHTFFPMEEMYGRAGGLMPVNPMMDLGISLFNFASRSIKLERIEGYCREVVKYFEVEEGDVVIIVNTYGVNACTLDAALESKEQGASTIGIVSVEAAKAITEDHYLRHSSKKNLFEVVDVYIDDYVPLGDVIVEFPGFPRKVAAPSTITDVFIIHWLEEAVVAELLDRGVTPPVWVSANIAGGDQDKMNAEGFKKYKWRVKYF